MNRTIKFRGWSNDDKSWMAPQTIEVWDASGELKAFYGGDYVIEQWTGLKDSQGVDIYEGDILLGSEARFEETLVSDPNDDLNFPVYEVHTDKPLPAPDVPFFRAKVTWNQSFCAFHLTYLWRRPDWGEAASTNLIDISYTYTVIGNIHENPELLKT